MRHLLSTTLAIASLTLAAAPACADAVTTARTDAEILDPGGRSPLVQIDFASVFRPERMPSITRDDVIVSWEAAGGIEPAPFRIVFPAGCFRGDRGFGVADFAACGGAVEFGGGAVEVLDVSARIVPREDGALRIDIRTAVMTDGNAGEILGALGGARMAVAIGPSAASLLPRDISTVGGIEPPPF